MIRDTTRARRALAMAFCVLAIPSLSFPSPALAQSQASVQVPLDEWQRLTGSHAHTVPPASLGVANVTVDVHEEGGRVVATATAQLTVRASAEGAAAILLPPGTAIDAATVDGQEIALVSVDGGLAWIAESAGAHRVFGVARAQHRSGADLKPAVKPFAQQGNGAQGIFARARPAVVKGHLDQAHAAVEQRLRRLFHIAKGDAAQDHDHARGHDKLRQVFHRVTSGRGRTRPRP